MTAERYAACHHVVASPTENFSGPVDDALEKLGLQRRIVVVVPGYPDAVRIARASDLVASVPWWCLGKAKPAPGDTASGIRSFELPVPLPEILVSAMWHPRMDADPAHRWLRQTVMTFCKKALSATPRPG